jgi:hypothetical protein
VLYSNASLFMVSVVGACSSIQCFCWPAFRSLVFLLFFDALVVHVYICFFFFVCVYGGGGEESFFPLNTSLSENFDIVETPYCAKMLTTGKRTLHGKRRSTR